MKYVSIAFKVQVNVGFNQNLNTVRILNACSLTVEGFICIKEAHKYGFTDQTYFYKIFKKFNSVTLSQFTASVRTMKC